MNDLFHIQTLMPRHAYVATMDDLNYALGQAGLGIDVGAAMIIRAFAQSEFEGWFANQGVEWQRYLMRAALASDPEHAIGAGYCSEIEEDDLLLEWYFEEDERNLAMLFKLAFGGL